MKPGKNPAVHLIIPYAPPLNGNAVKVSLLQYVIAMYATPDKTVERRKLANPAETPAFHPTKLPPSTAKTPKIHVSKTLIRCLFFGETERPVSCRLGNNISECIL